MKSFWRIFEYVKPQWHRLIIVVISAVLIGFLFSLSFATIIPLLKVMMGEEGLHGWVDRNVCKWRYGMDFYVPDRIDLLESEDDKFLYNLLVTSVEEKSPAEKAGIEPTFRITAAGPQPEGQKLRASEILERLASAEGPGETALIIKKIDQNNRLIENRLTLTVPRKSFYVNHIQAAVSVLPRSQDRSAKLNAVIFIIIAMGFVTILRCLATFVQKYMTDKVVHIAVADLRDRVFTHSLLMPVGFFSREGTSDTISRLVRDIADAGKGVQVLLGKTLREPLKAIGTLTVAMIISWKLTLIFLGIAPVVIGLLSLLGKRIKKATRRSLVSWAIMLGRLEDVMKALRVVKVYNRQDYEAETYRLVNRKLLKRLLRISRVEAATGPIMDVLGMIAGSAALIVGAQWVISTNMNPSSFFGLLVLLGTSAESIRKFSDVWNKLNKADSAAERVFSVLDEATEIEAAGATELGPVKEKIEFRDVIFAYPGTKKPVLDGVNLTVRAGHNVAIVGPNGSGKTTLVNLLPRFYDIDGGGIFIDETDIHQCTLKSLRSRISMVTQNVVTFNDTIAANIAYGKPDATAEEIREAARQSFAHEFIEPLSEGYSTVIGEAGSGFSGGQLQRIVIARAILKDPDILIFDEAMSQIDADSEAKIHRALEELMKERTCFIIAHRFSTVISADSIVVLNAGRIIAHGTHEELIQSSQLYRSLYETQLMAPA